MHLQKAVKKAERATLYSSLKLFPLSIFKISRIGRRRYRFCLQTPKKLVFSKQTLSFLLGFMFYMEGLSSAEIWKKEKNIQSLKIRKLNITRVHDITRYCPFRKLHKLHLTSHSTCSLVIVCFGRPPLFCWAAMGKLNLMAKLGISGLFGRPLTFLAAFFMISSLEFFIFTGF